LFKKERKLWLYQEGASFIFPEFWDKYLEPIPEAERSDMMAAYHKRLTGDNLEERKRCGKIWTAWELSTSCLFVDENYVAIAAGDEFSDAFARIECHYFMNAGFFRTDEQLLEEAHKISHIPGVIVQGRYDMVCPATTAWELKKKWPIADLFIIPDAGHAGKEEGITSELIKATEKFSTYDI